MIHHQSFNQNVFTAITTFSQLKIILIRIMDNCMRNTQLVVYSSNDSVNAYYL